MRETSIGKRFEFLSPRIIFGNDTMDELGSFAKEFGSRVLLVTGRSAMRKAGILDRAVGKLESAGLTVNLYDKVEPEVSCETVDLGTKFANETNSDAIISIGGGSALDCGKAIAIMMTHEGKSCQYQDEKKIVRDGIPFIALPSTAGTGSEITKNSVLINKKTGWKASIRHPKMTAKIAIVDTKLTLTMPPKVTAATGMDALTQAIESYVSLKSNPMSDTLAAKAISLLGNNIIDAVRNGNELEYREKMCLGSLLSALAFSNSGLGGVHGVAHPLGADFNIPHGEICAILLPKFIEYNKEYAKEKYLQIAKLLHPKNKSIEDCIQFINNLQEKIGISNLKQYNISFEQFKESVEKARGGSYNANPRKIDKKELTDFLIQELL